MEAKNIHIMIEILHVMNKLTSLIPNCTEIRTVINKNVEKSFTNREFYFNLSQLLKKITSIFITKKSCILLKQLILALPFTTAAGACKLSLSIVRIWSLDSAFFLKNILQLAAERTQKVVSVINVSIDIFFIAYEGPAKRTL